MKIILRPLFFSSLGLLAVLALACSSQATDSETEPSLSTDSSQSGTIAPTPIPVSPELIQDHAESQQAINEDWDSFHVDFDRWRSGITACDRAAAETALRIFASDFGDITSQARNLPGKGIARELPDEVIAAAVSEEASLRGLRDNWNPSNTMLLENAQTTRAAAADMLRATQVAVDRLEEMDDPDDRQLAKDFAKELAPVEAAWDEFYDSYGTLEDEHLELESSEIVSRLRDLVDEHEAIVEALEDIPSDKVTDPVQDPLIEAAESEAEALGDLLDTIRRAAREEATSMEENGEEASNGDESAETNGGNGASMDLDEGEETGNGPGNGAPQGSAQDNHQGSLALGENAGAAAPNVSKRDTGIHSHTSHPGTTTGASGQQGSAQTSEDSEENGDGIARPFGTL